MNTSASLNQSNRRPSALNKSPSLFYSHHNDMLCSVATIPCTAASFTCFCSAQITPEMVCVNELLQNSEKAKRGFGSVRVQRRQDKVSSRLKDPNRRRAAPPQTRRDVQRLRVRQEKCLSSLKKNKIKINTFREEFSATQIADVSVDRSFGSPPVTSRVSWSFKDPLWILTFRCTSCDVSSR